MHPLTHQISFCISSAVFRANTMQPVLAETPLAPPAPHGCLCLLMNLIIVVFSPTPLGSHPRSGPRVLSVQTALKRHSDLRERLDLRAASWGCGGG